MVGQAVFALEQFAVEPPPEPTQFHVRVVPQDVAPLSLLTDPTVQAPAVELHEPFTTQAAFAFEQFAVEPPFSPTHFHVRVVPHEVAPLSLLAEPAEQAPAVELQDPLRGTRQAGLGAVQFTAAPPFRPEHDHAHSTVLSTTGLSFPSAQRSSVGATEVSIAVADPHIPALTLGAEQLEVTPEAVQDHK